MGREWADLALTRPGAGPRRAPGTPGAARWDLSPHHLLAGVQPVTVRHFSAPAEALLPKRREMGPRQEDRTRGPEEEAEKPVKTKTVSSSNGGESSSRSAEKRSAEEEAADLPTKPTKISKFGFAIGSQTTKKASAISIKLGSTKPKETVPTLAPKTLSVAAAFNEDEDSEPEEMPPEAKMRMKNIGRDTPTSAGPNSFNKGKHGFSDNQKLWERNIKSHLGNVHDQDN